MKPQQSDSLPWWVCLAIAFLAVEFHISQQSLGGEQDFHDVHETPTRSLRARQTGLPGREPGLKLRTGSARLLSPTPALFVQVPCWNLPFSSHSLVTPCGNITVGNKAVIFKTPLGEERLPGLEDLAPELEQTEDFMSQYTVIFVAAMLVIWLVKKVALDREEMAQTLKDTLAGKLEDDEGLSEEEKKEQLADKMDPKTDGFIAPGNIYRVLAVLHPGILGYRTWGTLACKALVSAYMQLFIPFKIMKHTTLTWQVLGVKSPLWFMQNIGVFASMMAALLSLCNMFAGKCCLNIQTGAAANLYILSHQMPAPPGATDALYTAVPAAPDDATAPTMPPLPQPPRFLIKWNEYFWCCLSLVVNIGMSFLLQLAMFLKVATFTGAVEQVAIIAVSLYFVFELDNKVLEADPKMKTKYRKAVMMQTELREYTPMWIGSLAILCSTLLKAMVPFGLLAIVLLSWKSEDGIIIGGDGLTRK